MPPAFFMPRAALWRSGAGVTPGGGESGGSMTTNGREQRDGEEAAVDNHGNERGSRQRKGWKVRWTAARKRTFLETLAMTCNVKASAGAAGVDERSAFALRRRDEAFAAAWREAVAQGYTLLETLLIGHALAGGGSAIETAATTPGPLDRDLALKLLAFHRQGSPRSTQARGPRKLATPDETNAAIMTRLRVLAAAQAREDAARADKDGDR